MSRKSQRQKETAIQNVPTRSDKSDNDENERDDDDGLKCKYCDVFARTAKERQAHEVGCELKASANVFTTSDGKMRFLCTVSMNNQKTKIQT